MACRAELIQILHEDGAFPKDIARMIIDKTYPIQIGIGLICTTSTVSSSTTSMIIQLHEHCRRNNILVEMCPIGNEYDMSRGMSTLVTKLMTGNPSMSHLVFINPMCSVHPGVLKNIINCDKDFVGIPTAKYGYLWDKLSAAKSPSEMMSFKLNLTKDDRAVEKGFMKVQHVGFDFAVMKKQVIERMIEHYPELKFSDDTRCLKDNEQNWLYALFMPQLQNYGKKIHYLSEDYSFCHRWTSIGGEIYAYIACRSSMQGTHSFAGSFLKSVRFQPAAQ